MVAARLYLIPAAAPEDMAAPATWDMYPIESTAAVRHHAVRMQCSSYLVFEILGSTDLIVHLSIVGSADRSSSGRRI
jgi:hypothetical protein